MIRLGVGVILLMAEIRRSPPEIRIKPCNLMGYLPTSTGDVSRISSNHQHDDRVKGGSFHPLVNDGLPLDPSIICRSRSFPTAIPGFTTRASKPPGPKLWFFFGCVLAGWKLGGNSNIFGIFTPILWGNDPIWRAYFTWWVGSTTN